MNAVDPPSLAAVPDVVRGSFLPVHTSEILLDYLIELDRNTGFYTSKQVRASILDQARSMNHNMSAVLLKWRCWQCTTACGDGKYFIIFLYTVSQSKDGNLNLGFNRREATKRLDGKRPVLFHGRRISGLKFEVIQMSQGKYDDTVVASVRNRMCMDFIMQTEPAGRDIFRSSYCVPGYLLAPKSSGNPRLKRRYFVEAYQTQCFVSEISCSTRPWYGALSPAPTHRAAQPNRRCTSTAETAYPVTRSAHASDPGSVAIQQRLCLKPSNLHWIFFSILASVNSDTQRCIQAYSTHEKCCTYEGSCL